MKKPPRIKPISAVSPDCGMQPSPRKPATRAGIIRPAPLPAAATRRKIWQAACELVVAGEQRVISAVLSNRFRVSERAIGRVLVFEGMCGTNERLSLSSREWWPPSI